MKILIEVQGNEGRVNFRAKCLSVESAVQELYRFERNQEKLLDATEDNHVHLQ